MSAQPMNIRRCVEVVRRNKTLIGVAIAVGLLGGAAYGSINPPEQTAQAMVVLPTSAPAMATEIVIAESAPVLSGALSGVRPGMTVATLRTRVSASSPAANILQISAEGSTAAQAEGNANAVANSYIAYVSSSESPVGRVVARVLAPATAATGTSPLVQRIIFGVVGALVGFLVGFIVALARARGNRKLRLRDDIANSIGVPVLASVPAAHPSSAADWITLLKTYQPTPVYAWRLRKVLQQLSLSGVHLPGARGNGSGSSVSFVSVAGDRGALALGPQFAVFTASLGIPTALVIGPHQDPGFAASLRTACAELQRSGGANDSMLRFAVTDTRDLAGSLGGMLCVVVSVVGAEEPEVAVTAGTGATVIGVSSNAVTADQLARVAVSAAAADRDIAGFMVANPDPVDRTTGRIPQLVRLPHTIAPTRVTGTVTEVKR
jgi:capsular polysaccharide biosynthesis protein